MNLKNLFKKLFPSESDFRAYLRWREKRKREAIRLQKIRTQEEQRKREILAATDDPVDEDFDPISADVWKEVMEY